MYMLSKTTKIVYVRTTRYKYLKNDVAPVLVTTWKFLGIPVFVTKVVNP